MKPTCSRASPRTSTSRSSSTATSVCTRCCRRKFLLVRPHPEVCAEILAELPHHNSRSRTNGIRNQYLPVRYEILGGRAGCRGLHRGGGRAADRLDRFGRGGDHSAFNALGMPAVRFTENAENYRHQHQDLRTEGGVEYGDTLANVDFAYLAKVTDR